MMSAWQLLDDDIFDRLKNARLLDAPLTKSKLSSACSLTNEPFNFDNPWSIFAMNLDYYIELRNVWPLFYF